MNRLTRKCFKGLGVLVCATLVSSAAWGFSLEVAESPSTSLSLTVSAIQSAKESLYLNIYELSSSDVADALLSRINAGVHVEIIEEGQPVGGLSTASKGIEAQLAQAMRYAGGTDHLYEMTSHATSETRASKRRFHYDHAKYAVIDGKDLLVGSENYSPTGNPESGTKGNRGWEVLIHDPAIAAEFAQVFRSDSDLSHGDLIDVTVAGSASAGGTSSSAGSTPSGDWANVPAHAHAGVPAAAPPAGPTAPWTQPTLLSADSVVRVTSPDTSLSGLLDLINNAQKSIDIEQMTFDSAWGKIAPQSLLLKAVIDAARRGVKIRVLLNDESVFDHANHPSASKNLVTINTLNQLSRSENLDVTAATANIKKMGVTYIHNKGVLVDGNKTLISSINWDSNAVLNNREAAVVITGSDVFDHYAALFNGDWQASTGSASAEFTESRSIESKFLETRQLDTFSEVCPDRMRVTVEIGKLHAADPEDTSFAAISESRFTSDFVRTTGGHSCIMIDTRASARTGKSRFIEIRKKADGTRSASLEGYTTEGKVYSIRTVLDAEGPFDGIYTANVYDGSGPAREKLGAAKFEIQIPAAGPARARWKP